MTCPKCKSANVELRSPDYGQGAEYVCYGCDPYGRRFISSSKEAKQESTDSRQQSRENAQRIR